MFSIWGLNNLENLSQNAGREPIKAKQKRGEKENSLAV